MEIEKLHFYGRTEQSEYTKTPVGLARKVRPHRQSP